MQAFFEMVVEQKCEGLMVKLLESGEGIVGDDEEDDGDGSANGDGKRRKSGGAGSAVATNGANGTNGAKRKPLPATYEPDQRSQGWLKVKKGGCSP
jgi:DNA ligase-1